MCLDVIQQFCAPPGCFVHRLVVIPMLYYDVAPDDCRDLPRVLKPEEVAEFLCVHKNTVYKLIKQGLLPAFRVGKSWRIYRKDLPKLSTSF